MKAKNTCFTKALSVILTVIMLLSTVSVGIILPETKLTADAATYTVTSVAELNSAIANANSAGSGTTTTIKLGSDISTTGSVSSLTTITGKVLFDFNGKNLTFTYNQDGSNSSDTVRCLPAGAGSSVGDFYQKLYMTTAMIMVSSSGSIQFVNTSGTDSKCSVLARCYVDTDGRLTSNDTYTTATSAALVYSEGTVIIGDKSNSGYNNFTLKATAVSTNEESSTGYDKQHCTANAYSVTLNNSASAKLFMYGGTVSAQALSRGNHGGNLNACCFPLDINACYSAEIYGGTLRIAEDDGYNCGFANSDNTVSGGGIGFFATIRTTTNNVYIFNVNSSVYCYGNKDTTSATIHAYNVFTSSDATPHIYGGSFVNTTSKKDDKSCTLASGTVCGTDAGYGHFQIANAGLSTGNYVVTDLNRAVTSNGNHGANINLSFSIFTLMYFGDSKSNNTTNYENTSYNDGVYPWSYASFRDYISAVNASGDPYKTKINTHIGDGANYTTETDCDYRRVGYTQTGWYGSFDVGTENGNVTQGRAAGTLFAYPKWSLNTYTITYDLNDSSYSDDTHNYADSASHVSGFNTSKTYTIESTGITLGTPVRHGYTFAGWLLTATSFADKDNSFSTTPWAKNVVYTADTVVGNNNPALHGFGNLTLVAKWEINSYTIGYDLDGGVNPPSDVTYTVEDTLVIPASSNITKTNYVYQNRWKVKNSVGSWIANNAYDEGHNMGRGNWGDVTLVAQYNPQDYQVIYNTDGGSNIEDASFKSYNVESTHSLPATTKTGYDFIGWEAQMSSGTWTSGQIYTQGTSFNGNYGNITFKAIWRVKTFTVTYDVKSDENFGTTSFNYAYDRSYVLTSNPTKTAYTFAGWKVKSVATGGTWTVGEVFAPDSVTGKVTIPANKQGNVTLEATWNPITYQVSFNSNGGTTFNPINYTKEDTVTLPNSTKNGYTFGGWQVTGTNTGNWSGTYNAGNKTDMYGNVALVALWTPVVYTVTLDPNGGSLGSAPSTMSYDIEAEETERRLPVPTKTGYEFTNWEVTTAAGTWVAADTYTDYLPAGKYGNVTIKANWAPVSYKIKYSTIGNALADKSYTIEDTFTLPTSDCPGRTFTNWTLGTSAGNWTAGTYNTSAELSGKYGNITLVANFTPNTYTITYNYADGTSSTVNYNIDDTVTIDSYSYGGYTFNGWQVSSCTGGNWYEGAVFTPCQLDSGYYGFVELEPVLDANDYQLTFDSDGGTAVAPLSYTIEDDTALPTSVKAGYDFAGWKVETAAGNWTANAVMATDAVVTGKWGNASLKATWTPKNYTITWVTGSGTNTTQAAYGSTPSFSGNTSKPSDAQYNYYFREWNPAVSAVTGEATYTAQYNKVLRSYTITWVVEPNETSGTQTTTAVYNYGETPVYNNGVNPTKESSNAADHVWRFTGWDTAISPVTGNKTYTAQYKSIAAPRTVTWNIDGVSSSAFYEVGETPEYGGTPYKAPADGYEYNFTGWSPAIVTVAANTDYTYTAQFAPSAKSYVATFNPAGGTLYETEISYNRDDGMHTPLVTRNGYTFTGWKVTTAGGTWVKNTVYDAGEAILDKWGTVTFTAQWELTDYTVKFVTSEGTAPDDLQYTTESTDTIPACTRDGYEMTAYTVTEGTGCWTLGTTVSVGSALTGKYGDVKLSPIWYPKTYTITWISGDTVQETYVQYGSAISALDPISKAGYTSVWDEEVPEIMPAHDLTFTAEYSLIEYSVRVIVNGGEPIDNFTYNIESHDVLPTPYRDGTTFDGWRITIASGNWTKNDLKPDGFSLNGKYGNITITAEWTLETHTVTFVAGDIVKETEWYHGSVPFYNGTPVKASDESFSYVFVGWDRDFIAVTGDTTYTALFEATDRIYTVTWNVDNHIITQNYSYGQLPVYPYDEDPTKASTEQYDFTFAGWDTPITPITKDVTFIAQWEVFTKLLGLSLDSSAKFLDAGQTDTLTAKIYPQSASVKDITWSTANPDIATIDSDGKITAVSTGVTLVKASSKDGRFNSFCLVEVSATHTNYVLITAGGVSTTNLVGNSVQLYATVMPDNATNLSTVWSSSDPSIASVDANGLVTFIKKGTATITCVAADGYALGTITVTGTEDAGEVKDEVKTHVVLFVASSCDYIIGGQRYESVSVIVKEGETVAFKTVDPDFVLVDGKRYLKDDDGYYRISNITKNYSVLTSETEYDLPDEDEVPESIQDLEEKMTFIERIQAFFRKIVLWFRSIFG